MAIHHRAIAAYGGGHGVRDPGALESAISRPSATFEGQLLHPDLFLQAAAYLFHITQNHPFVDGNKRTGAASAVIFLAMNGKHLAPSANDALEAITWKTARGECNKHELGMFFDANCE